MKLKNIILGIAAIVMIVAITVGITVAYLTDTDKVDNVITLGDVDIKLREYERVSVDTPNASAEAQVQTFNDNKPLLPAVVTKDFDYATNGADVKWDKDKDGNKIKPNYTSSIWNPADINNEVDKMVFVENTGKSDAYVRVFFAFEAGNYTSFTRFKDMVHINLNDAASEWAWEWNPALATSDKGGNYFIATATYLPILKSGEFTTISLSQIALDPTAVNKDVLAFGEKYEVSVFVQGIQTVGFDNSDQALTKGFGDDIPFTGLTFETGVKLKTALHYLNGEESEDKKITANVSTVTFGLNKDYKKITSNYEPTYVGIDQDVAVYSYYVPNADDASKYDVYVLADSEIYTPKDSTGLFQDMSALITVNTTNMDVSRTVNMKAMFMGCEALTSLDVSKWNVSNVEAMNMTFTYCSSLKELNVSGWNVGKVTTMSSMFYDCSSLESLNVTNWNVENVTIMQMLFYDCQKLKNINLSNWQVGNVTLMNYMFYGCHSITSLDIANWDVRKVTTLERFLSRNSRFSQQMNISEIDISGWQTDSLTNMNHMFQGCQKLTSLDMSGWNTSQVTQMAAVFEICEGLKTLNVSGWDVSNVETMEQLFRRCGKLTELDLSKWNTASLKETTSMFAAVDATGPSALETIYVGDGWDMSKVTTSGNMFYGCVSLKGEKNTPYDSAHIDVTYAHIDGGTENPGYFTYKAADNATQNQ